MSLWEILTIIGVVCLLIYMFGFLGFATIFVLPSAIKGSILAHKSKDWPSTQGSVISKIKTVKNNAGEMNQYTGLSYHYIVEGIDYESERVEFDGEDPDDIKLAKFVSDNDQVTVYYRPDNPTQYILRPGIHGKIIQNLIIGTGWLLGLVIFIGGMVYVFLH